MKKSLLLLAAFALAATSPSFAQTAPVAAAPHGKMHHQPKTPEQSAQHHTASLTKKLGLNADQQTKVYQIFLTEAQQGQSAKAAATSRQGMRQDMQAMRTQQQQQLQAVLTPAQYSQLVAMKQERKDHKGHGKNKS
ncbi:MAG: hypothetical protein ACRYFX_21105 [Janthinobacterium lividum]